MTETALASSATQLAGRFESVRSFTSKICEPLEIEDYVIQSMPDVSPMRWHVAHTTWFFETFVLKPHRSGYASSNEAFEYLFNSYYNTVGEQFPRSKRGLLSRPSVEEVWNYRAEVDRAMTEFMAEGISPEVASVVEIGLQHEQQHQELMLTDIKHVLSCNPLFPEYHDITLPSGKASAASWYPFAGGVRSFGFDESGSMASQFYFDNEAPRHEGILQDYHLQDRLVNNREYLEFMDDGGYRRPEFWLSMGWSTAQDQEWNAPLYWVRQDGNWHEFTLSGLRPLDLDAPVCHVSYFEADAFARWSRHRLPTEFEWENAAATQSIEGNFADTLMFHPASTPSAEPKLRQFFGDVWEWTASPYIAYPGYKPPLGALGEYNGKFMCNQYVLRGGSCVTSQSHIRATYRNFFPPDARWQFSGIRLAK